MKPILPHPHKTSDLKIRQRFRPQSTRHQIRIRSTFHFGLFGVQSSQQLNMNSQTHNGSQNGTNGSASFLPLLRLALLILPEFVVFKTLSRSPVVSWAAAVVVLAVWLTIDVWPFRVESPKLARARIPTQIQPVARQKMNRAERLNHLFCRMILFALMFHSKMTM